MPPKAIYTEPYRKLTPTPWMRERAGLLHRLCENVDRRVGKGMLIGKAIQQVLARCAFPEYYQTDPNRRFKISFVTLQRHYGKWRESPAPETFLPSYRVPPRRLNQEAIAALVDRVLESENLSDAIRSLNEDWQAGFSIPGLPRRGALGGKPPADAKVWRRALGPQLCAELEAFFASRRRVRRQLLRMRAGHSTFNSTSTKEN